jgi:hypothetical protein
MNRTYTQFQVMDALTRQGYSPEQAESMAAAMGDMRASPSQVKAGYRAVGAPDADLPMGRDGRVDSTFMPNLVDGITFAGAGHLLNKHLGKLEPEQLKGRMLGNKSMIVPLISFCQNLINHKGISHVLHFCNKASLFQM